MTTREKAIEIAAKAIARATSISKWFVCIDEAAEAYDALLAAGVIPAEGMVVVDKQRWERIRKIAGRAKTADRAERVAMLELDGVRRARLQVESFMRRIEMGESCDELQPGDLDAIPDAPTGEGER